MAGESQAGQARSSRIERPIHVCFVALHARPVFRPELGGRSGGAELQVFLLATALAALPGFHVTVLVADAGQPLEEQVNGVTLRRVGQPPRGGALGRPRRRIGSALSLWRTTRDLGADVYIQRAAGVETGIVEHAARRLGAPLIFMAAADSEHGPTWARGRSLTARAFRRGIGGAALVLAQHEDQRAAMERTWGRPTIALPSVYPFPPPRVARDRRVLWVGRCVDPKQPLRFLELVRQVPHAAFTMVAQRSEAEAALFDETRQRAPALSNLEWIVDAPRDALAQVYERCGIFVSTSWFEGMPNTFLEAAAHGLAIVSLTVDPGGILGRLGAGQCAGGAMDRLAGMVRDLYDDATLRARWAERAGHVMRERHEVNRIAPRLAEIIRETVMASRRATP